MNIDDDKLAAQIHGAILSESDSDSDDSGQSESDEELQLYRPPPIPREDIQHAIVQIEPFQVVNHKNQSKIKNDKKRVCCNSATNGRKFGNKNIRYPNGYKPKKAAVTNGIIKKNPQLSAPVTTSVTQPHNNEDISVPANNHTNFPALNNISTRIPDNVQTEVQDSESSNKSNGKRRGRRRRKNKMHHASSLLALDGLNGNNLETLTTKFLSEMELNELDYKDEATKSNLDISAPIETEVQNSESFDKKGKRTRRRKNKMRHSSSLLALDGLNGNNLENLTTKFLSEMQLNELDYKDEATKSNLDISAPIETELQNSESSYKKRKRTRRRKNKTHHSSLLALDGLNGNNLATKFLSEMN